MALWRNCTLASWGLFGPGSDPWSGSISCVGDPLNKTGEAPTADLVVRRERLRWVANDESRFGPPQVPEKYQLRCEMVALSEIGTEAITVTYDQGKRPEQWDVRVELAKRHPGGGMIYITHVNPDGNGGLADIEIAVKVAFIFSHDGEEVVAESRVEWLSETNHSFARWLDSKTTDRFYVPQYSVGSFIPAMAPVGGQTVTSAACSKNSAVAHSFILPPRRDELTDKWGTFRDVWQLPERRG